jgi:hypothetical protein
MFCVSLSRAAAGCFQAFKAIIGAWTLDRTKLDPLAMSDSDDSGIAWNSHGLWCVLWCFMAVIDMELEELALTGYWWHGKYLLPTCADVKCEDTCDLGQTCDEKCLVEPISGCPSLTWSRGWVGKHSRRRWIMMNISECWWPIFSKRHDGCLRQWNHWPLSFMPRSQESVVDSWLIMFQQFAA